MNPPDRYLVDTSTFIRHARGDEPLSSRLARLVDSSAEVGITAMVVLEFFSGLPSARRGTWAEYFSRFSWWPDDLQSAAGAGARRYDMARAGRQLSLPDSLIAEVARRAGAIVVTENRDDFAAAGIPVLSLSTEPI